MFTGPNTVTDGLVLALDAANVKSYPGSGTTWANLNKNQYSGSLLNDPTYITDFGGGFSCDGTNDRFETNIEYDNWAGHSWSIEGWFSYDNANRNNGWFEMGRLNSSGNWGISTVPRNGKFYFYWVESVNSGHSFVSPEIANSNLIQVVLTYEKVEGTPTQSDLYDATKTYLNGQPIAHANDGSAAVSTTSRLWINSQQYPMAGDIYSVKYYEKVLTDAEVQQNYNATKSRFNL